MKNLILNIIILVFALVSCNRQDNASYTYSKHEAPLHYSVFQDITNLMTPSPDSAFLLISAFFDTINQADLTAPDRHEYNILWAEALYKNDYLQSNDSAVNEAVQFYDSIVRLYPKNLDLQFQKARAYYYKGIGDKEKDDIVATCKDYLKTLGVLENCFPEKDCDNSKTRFKGVIYSVLGRLLYNEYAIPQAKSAYKNAYKHFSLVDDEISEIHCLEMIGKLFNDEKKFDSAAFYYEKILDNIDTINYRLYYNILGDLAVTYYNAQMIDTALLLMDKTINDMIKYGEDVSGTLSIYGTMLYEQSNYEYAKWCLLQSVKHSNRFTRMYSANNLSKIYETEGNIDSFNYYRNIYLNDTERDTKKAADKPKIAGLYDEYEDAISDRIIAKRISIALSLILTVFFVTLLLIIRHRRKIKNLNKEKQLLSIEKEKISDDLKLSQIQLEASKGDEAFEARWEKFEKTDIYIRIKTRVRSKNISVRNVQNYPSLKLKLKDFMLLRNTVNDIFKNALDVLSHKYPRLMSDDLNFCCLALLELEIAEMAVLSGTKYNAADARINKICSIVDTKENLSNYMQRFLRF